MIIGGSNVEQVVILKDDEVVAVISDAEIIEKNGYEVKIENAKTNANSLKVKAYANGNAKLLLNGQELRDVTNFSLCEENMVTKLNVTLDVVIELDSQKFYNFNKPGNLYKIQGLPA